MARKEVGFSPEGAIRASGFCRACRKQEEGQAGETREGEPEKKGCRRAGVHYANETGRRERNYNKDADGQVTGRLQRVRER